MKSERVKEQRNSKCVNFIYHDEKKKLNDKNYIEEAKIKSEGKRSIVRSI